MDVHDFDVAQLFGPSLWFSANSAADDLIRTWGIAPADIGTLTNAVQLGFILGTTTAYLINRRWTFKAEPSAARFVAVMVLYLVTFAVQVGLYAALEHLWSSESWLVSALSFVIAQGTATVINFVVQRAVIFKLK